MPKAKTVNVGDVKQGQHRSSLSLRRTSEGLRIVGEAPSVHLLTTSFINRGIAEGDVEVLVRFAGLTYALRGYEQDENGKPISTSWVVELVEREE
jgi:hypothetical protein